MEILMEMEIRSNVSQDIESDTGFTKVLGGLLMALLKEKFIQRTYSDYVDKY